MSYEVENLEHSMAKIKIEVSADVFEAAVVKAYNKNKNRISLPGFRKGKAPRKLIEKQFMRTRQRSPFLRRTARPRKNAGLISYPDRRSTLWRSRAASHLYLQLPLP